MWRVRISTVLSHDFLPQPSNYFEPCLSTLNPVCRWSKSESIQTGERSEPHLQTYPLRVARVKSCSIQRTPSVPIHNFKPTPNCRTATPLSYDTKKSRSVFTGINFGKKTLAVLLWCSIEKPSGIHLKKNLRLGVCIKYLRFQTPRLFPAPSVVVFSSLRADGRWRGRIRSSCEVRCEQ